MSITLSDKALVNLYTFIEYYGAKAIQPIDLSLSSMSGSFISAINQASEGFHNAIGFNLFSGSLMTEYQEGNDDTEIYLERSIEGMSDVRVFRVRYREGPDLTDFVNIDGANVDWSWSYDATAGKVYTVDGNRFFSNPYIENNWEFQYDYGLSGSATEGAAIPATSIPLDIQYAICQWTWRIVQLRKHQGFESSTSVGGVSKSYNLNFIPQEVKDTINKYKRYV